MPEAELAPRDVVARANWRRLHAGRRVYLDATHLGAGLPERFPTVFAAAIEAGLDPRSEWMPVSPAAHYHMGGIAVDATGRTSLPGLYAAGEASVTGLHGANRLASNSLLEGLVFGAEVAGAIAEDPFRLQPGPELEVPASTLGVGRSEDEAALRALRSLMWDEVGVLRTERGLRDAAMALETLGPKLSTGLAGRNLAAVATCVAAAALERRESRGGHHRLDHPNPSPAWRRHTVLSPRPERRIRLSAAMRGAA